jgi:Caspase domain/Putative peptidoglycan binding domain
MAIMPYLKLATNRCQCSGGAGVMRLFQLLAVALLFLTLAPSSALAEKRVALVIGNSNYRNVARLPNPEKDADSIAKLFRDSGFDTVVTSTNVGNLDFKRAIRKFEDAAYEADIAVVFYAGHGIEVGGVNYLVPVDAKLATDRDAEDEAISLNRVVESVEGAKRLRLVILDACRNNPFVATMKRRSALRSVTSGLGKVEPTGTDTLIAYAAKGGSTAEDGEGAHSPFTTALLDNLAVPGLDIRLAFGRVRDEVLKITNRRQEPFVYGSLGGGNIALVPAPEKPKAPDVAKVKADYELVAQIGNKKAWGVFLQTYPTGFYADLARAQLSKLESKLALLEPPPPPEPAKPTSDELRAWNRIKGTSNKGSLEKFIELYPNSPLALDAQHRLDILDRAAREREDKARAEREAAQHVRQQRLAAQQKAEEERRIKEAARLAELKAESERRAKDAATSEKQKEQQAARVAALQAEIDRRSKELVQSEKREGELACSREQTRLDELKAADSSTAARDNLKQLSDSLTCERLRPQVVAALEKATDELKKSEAPPADTPALIVSAQKELARLGCYSGPRDGKLDADTKVAIKKYQVQKNQEVNHIAVTEDFVSELSKQKLRVCPTIVERPKPQPSRKEAQQKRSKPSKSAAKPKARRQAGGSGHTMIGIGF